MVRTGNMKLVISNKEINAIMKILESIEESEQLKMKQKNKKEDFLECY